MYLTCTLLFLCSVIFVITEFMQTGIVIMSFFEKLTPTESTTEQDAETNTYDIETRLKACGIVTAIFLLLVYPACANTI